MNHIGMLLCIIPDNFGYLLRRKRGITADYTVFRYKRFDPIFVEDFQYFPMKLKTKHTVGFTAGRN